MRRFICFISFAVMLFCVVAAHAAQFTIEEEIYLDYDGNTQAGSYIGEYTRGSYAGAVSDGGYDAFDDYGMLGFDDRLSVHRQTEAFTALNTYRWLDTFTNDTDSTIRSVILFFGDLGSDDSTTTEFDSGDDHLLVTSDRDQFRDPAIAHVNGNNEWATDHMFTNFGWYNEDEMSLFTVNLTLDPGESASILHFAFLARDEDEPRNVDGDLALAISTGQNLVNNPYLEGLSQAQVDTIVNFDTGTYSSLAPVPEPATMFLLGGGMLGMLGMKRRNT